MNDDDIPRRAVLAGLLAGVAACSVGPACRAGEPLRAEQEGTLALREVSGLAIGTLVGSTAVVLAVGDEAESVTLVPLVDGLPDYAHARALPLPLPSLPGGSQLEAVAIAEQHIWTLSEGASPTVSEVVLEDDGLRLLRSGPLVVPADHPLAAAWDADPNRRGEGLVVASDHVLVAKQASPAAIIAFRWVPGDGSRTEGQWRAGDVWRVDVDDLSDLTRGPDGALYAIGASARAICRLATLVPGGGDVACTDRWELPEALGKGKTQWEGLAFLPDGRPLVAVDRKKHDTPNLAVLPVLRRSGTAP